MKPKRIYLAARYSRRIKYSHRKHDTTSDFYWVSRSEPCDRTPEAILKRWWKHLWEFEAPDTEPNPLPILTRAINAVGMRLPIRQPCWRAGRWRSLT